ncbi:transcription initiation factor IID, TAF10 subunit [Gonapodya prolifera JEL478]|uniref:Transcription initiation factor IID, TAF10 subunit n=1 Tax=Gonapodya prolifera (strain JEL478) TaxID=1344416 RepID=A0A139A6B3_GONPJ|nr:transcription initiation factor IID, TAF10 subunit [Gonapodya prolifera JEL478]|eukprot:KXS12342.1 transcription initiation factor IID, TAF10 subunit [Gonapodya prolifera JEL478]
MSDPMNIDSTPPQPSSSAMRADPDGRKGKHSVVDGDNSATGPGAAGAGGDNVTKPTRADDEMAAKERSLAEFLVQMDDFAPVIPDAVTDYYISRAGFECDDVRIKRLLALAAQKFISDIATDALQLSKVRQQSGVGGRGGRAGAMYGRDRRATLSMEDLGPALARHGVNARKPDYLT